MAIAFIGLALLFISMLWGNAIFISEYGESAILLYVFTLGFGLLVGSLFAFKDKRAILIQMSGVALIIIGSLIDQA